MRLLIAISSKEYSEATLKIGLEIARAFKACVTIACVSPKSSSFTRDQVRLAQESMERWNFDQPAVSVLEWAFDYLKDNQFISPESCETGFQKKLLVKRAGTRGEINLEGVFCKQVNLILRFGEIISELRDEVQKHSYDVTIIGGSQKRRMAHDLVQYIDSSILVVKQIDFNKLYRVLLAVDDSKGTKKAVDFGITIAKAYKLEVDVLTVSKRQRFGSGYRGASDRACQYLEEASVKYQRHLKVGDPVETIVAMAGENHITIMGISSKNPLKKFFVGSKPVSVMGKSDSPILIVK
ncbi:MAG: universal stress protein [Candidatus Marinimicrobia bacterium]|nr:universal stress protein [Candidatus Neomarinimicrobiota bacterium]